MEPKKIIISLGGSMVAPDMIDAGFVRSFHEMIVSYVSKGFQFYIIVGGGKIARMYSASAKEISMFSKDELDWLGIYTTRLNAEFIRTVFKDLAHDQIILDPTLAIQTDKSVVVGGGWKPGWSTDYVAVTLAKTIGSQRVLNISNVDYVYDADPRTNPDAQKIEKISWAEYRKLIPTEWDPGISYPFDPIASKLAEESHIEVDIINGKRLDQVKNSIERVPFEGTIIS